MLTFCLPKSFAKSRFESKKTDKPAPRRSTIISTWLLALSMAILHSTPASAWVRPATNLVSGANDLGTCGVQVQADDTTDSAVIGILTSPFTTAGGAYWNSGIKEVLLLAPSASDLESDCGLSSVTISSNVGADGIASYADQVLMELVLRATEDADGKTYDYVYRLQSTDKDSAPVLTRTKTEVVVADATPPTVTSILRETPAANPTDSDSLTFTVTFSEDVQNVSADDFTPTGTTAMATAFSDAGDADASTWSVTVSGGDLANLNGTVGLGVAGGHNIADLAGNALTDTTPTGTNETFTVANDSTNPNLVSLLGLPTSISGAVTFDATFTFSENVTGFAIGDITIVNGTVNSISGGPAAYTVNITADGAGDLTLSLAAGVVIDGAGNPNDASAVATVAATIVEATQEVITDFVQNRATNIMNTAPDIGGFLTGEFGGPVSRNLNLRANDRGVTLNAAGSLLSRGSSKNFAGKTDVWTQVRFVHSEANTAKAGLFIGYLGAHRFVSENLLVGIAAQFDYAEENDTTAGYSGKGYGLMIGPYLAGRINQTNLRYEAQASIGGSYNEVSPTGVFTDGYHTTRWSARGKLEGSLKRGLWTVKPGLSIAYFNEVQGAYTDSLANPIAAQTISLGEVRAGFGLQRTFQLGNGQALRTSFGAAAVSNFNVANTSGSQGFPLGNGTLRTRLDMGLATQTKSGIAMSAKGFVDGLGVASYMSYGVTLRAQWKF